MEIKRAKYRKLKVKGYSKVSVVPREPCDKNHILTHYSLSLFFFYQDTKIEFEMLSVTSDSGGSGNGDQQNDFSFLMSEIVVHYYK